MQLSSCESIADRTTPRMLLKKSADCASEIKTGSFSMLRSTSPERAKTGK